MLRQSLSETKSERFIEHGCGHEVWEGHDGEEAGADPRKKITLRGQRSCFPVSFLITLLCS